MPCDRRFLARFGLLAALLCVGVLGLISTSPHRGRSPDAGTLYLVGADANNLSLSASTPATACTEPNLVVITHGWYDREPWPEWTALAIARRVNLQEWQCGWCDWRRPANCLRPSQAATIGRDSVGPQLGRQIVGLSRDWRHVHLVGHSAGAWAIQAAAQIIASKTSADVHITFLDAYVPDGWDARVLGKLNGRSSPHCWVEHYFTRDLLNLTENILPGAHNVDITALNPGFKGHKFPWHWYLATVTGAYTTDEDLADRPVLCRTDRLAYGFARARENGSATWTKSLALEPGNSPVRMLPPADPNH